MGCISPACQARGWRLRRALQGMRTLGGLRFKPFLPDCWNGYSYKFNYRGRIIELRVKPKRRDADTDFRRADQRDDLRPSV